MEGHGVLSIHMLCQDKFRIYVHVSRLASTCVLPIFFAQGISSVWGAVAVIGLATAAHQAFSANLYAIPSDMFPRGAVGSVVGIGGTVGAIGGMVAGSSFILNRFTGPGRLGIQSMTYHPPQPEGAQQAGGQSNINLGQFFQ